MNVGRVWEFLFLKKSFLGGALDVIKGLRWLIIRSGPKTISIHSNLTKKQHSVNIPQLTKVPIHEPTCLFMVNSLHVQLLCFFWTRLRSRHVFDRCNWTYLCYHKWAQVSTKYVGVVVISTTIVWFYLYRHVGVGERAKILFDGICNFRSQ